MARAVACLILITVCSFLVFAEARRTLTSAEVEKSAAPEENKVLAESLCEESLKPKLCVALLQNDQKTLKSKAASVQARVAIHLAKSMAKKAEKYLKLNCDKKTKSVKESREYYENMVKDLKHVHSSYKTESKQLVLKSLRDAKTNLELCQGALKTAGVTSPFIEDANKLILKLVTFAEVSTTNNTKLH